MPLEDGSQRVEALVAGTLCLMSCYARSPRQCHANRIVQNLDALAHEAGVTPELRSLCRRLCDRWELIADELGDRFDAESSPAVRH